MTGEQKHNNSNKNKSNASNNSNVDSVQVVESHRRAGSYYYSTSSHQESSSFQSYSDTDSSITVIMDEANLIPATLPGQTRKRNVFDVLESIKTTTANNLDHPAKVLIRVDFNVPMNDRLEITDDSRIRGALPTIQAVLRSHCHAILVSHLGRPKAIQKSKDTPEALAEREKLSLRPVATYLSQLLQRPVIFGEDCIGEPAEQALAQLPAEGGGLVLLENLRFYKQEEKNDDAFAKSLAAHADAYVNDAFGTCHRAHASVSGVPALLPPALCGVGCLVASEINFLDFSHVQPGEHVAAVIGGSKVSTKLPVIQGLLKQVHTLVLGGGLAFTFLKAQGIAVGSSLVEEGMIETAKDLLRQAEETGKIVVLPVDAVCTTSFPKGPMSLDDTKTFDMVVDGGIEDGWMGLDVGPKTVALFQEKLQVATKLVLNGPMGVFEVPPFDAGTRGLVDVLADLTKAGCVVVVGGGDSVAALEAFGQTQSVTYVSTGGGVTLELLAGEVLPGVAAIADYTETA